MFTEKKIILVVIIYIYGLTKWAYSHTYTKEAMNREAQGRKIKTMHLCFHTFGLFNIGNVMLEIVVEGY